MPEYSDKVLATLQEQLMPELSPMVEETAYHILRHLNIINSHDYSLFCARVVALHPQAKYPSRGSKDWVG